ncbi:MAG: LuxR C-terminal-related transcriptional regulator [Micromonosporaceae bacterium]
MTETIAARDVVTTQLRRGLQRLSQVEGFTATIGGEVTGGGTRLVLTELRGLRYELLRGVMIEPGIGLGGRVLERRRPASVEDYVHSTGITHQFDRAVLADRIRAAIAFPVQVHGTIRAVVYGTARTAMSFGDRTLDAAMAVVRKLAHDIAVEEEVARRLERLRQERSQQARGDLGPLTGDDLAALSAELADIAATVSDPELKERLASVRLRLAGGAESAGSGATVHLSGRECDVLTQVAVGYTNKEIADRLLILPTTVKTHLQSAMRKLGVRNRVELVHAARHAGLLR